MVNGLFSRPGGPTIDSAAAAKRRIVSSGIGIVGVTMAREFRHLQNLLDLAREPSSEKRRQLLRQVTDLFLDAPEELSASEIGHFSDVIGRIAFDL